MTDRVDDLLRRFREEHHARGSADPRPYLSEVAGMERAELAALIDGYLSRAPGPAFDAARFAEYRATAPGRRAAERVVRATRDADLVALRDEAKLSRARLVDRLAAELGLAERRAAVAHRYHQLEQGLLEPAGVSERVWEALGGLLRRSADAVRAAAPGPAGAAGTARSGAVFARRSAPDPEYLPGTAAAASPVEADDEDAEVDALFLGPGG